MPVVAEALSDDALTTVEAVEAELGLAAGTEPRIAGWINDASALIVEFCGRPFARRDDMVERFPGTGDAEVLLSLTPVLAISSLTHRDVPLPTTGYEIADAAAGSLVFVAGYMANDATRGWGILGSPVAGSERFLYTVTYSGGYVTPPQAAAGGAFVGQPVTLPRIISRSCIETVTMLRSRKGQNPDIASESALSYSVSYRGGPDDPDGGGLPYAVAAKLQRYRRDAFA